MFKYFILLLFLITPFSIIKSQSIELQGDYPLLNKDYKGILDVGIQYNLIETKNYNWHFGLRLDYLRIKSNENQGLELFISSFQANRRIYEIGHELGLELLGGMGFSFFNDEYNLTYNIGAQFVKVITNKAQLLFKFNQNYIHKEIGFLNLGIGLRVNIN